MKREKLIYGIFLLLGLVTIRQIGIVDFLFGTKWESTASPSIIYGLVGMLF